MYIFIVDTSFFLGSFISFSVYIIALCKPYVNV
nr:MAG TPA: hypothetical protein [Caudoviricetes sp.]